MPTRNLDQDLARKNKPSVGCAAKWTHESSKLGSWVYALNFPRTCLFEVYNVGLDGQINEKPARGSIVQTGPPAPSMPPTRATSRFARRFWRQSTNSDVKSAAERVQLRSIGLLFSVETMSWSSWSGTPKRPSRKGHGTTVVRHTHRCTSAGGWKLPAHLQSQTSCMVALLRTEPGPRPNSRRIRGYPYGL